MSLSVHSDAPGAQTVLTDGAKRFLAFLAVEFEDRRQQLLRNREIRQTALDAGELPDFLPETAGVRADDNWRVAPMPADLRDRRVEITGPVSPRKMVINALNSGAKTFMADLEDSTAPTFANVIDGQVNLRDAVRRTISFDSGAKQYRLVENPAVLLVRPRGWHLDEAHVTVDGRPMSASLFDFGLYFFHNVVELLRRGSGPYFYLPKMESHLEARLWNDVFVAAQDYLGVEQGTIRATVLIETVLAAFEMDEILFELRDHSSGLNCGRWDYIFSLIKKFRAHPAFVMPDRGQIGMAQPCMEAYVRLLIRTCHRRGAHAMGGMAADIPVRGDEAKTNAALERVRADKLREVQAGHDGTWVAHPALVQVARDAFDAHMPADNQVALVPAAGADTCAADLLAVPTGSLSLDALRANVRIGLQYTEAWLRGVGCVPINHKMEDAATAEISRCQVWQQVHHAVVIEGTTVTPDYVHAVLAEEVDALAAAAPQGNRFRLAGMLMGTSMCAPQCHEFLTSDAYPSITKVGSRL